jgi:hypothetical protein
MEKIQNDNDIKVILSVVKTLLTLSAGYDEVRTSSTKNLAFVKSGCSL